MLFKCSRRAYYVPVLFVGLSGVLARLFLWPFVVLQGRVGTRATLLALFSAIYLYIALAKCRVLSVKGEALWVRGLHRRRSLDLGACVFGVSPEQRGPRGGYVYVVFVTDGVVSEPIGEWFRESPARAAVSRLQALVGPQATNPRRDLAARQVAQIDQEWEERKQRWAAYRQSKVSRHAWYWLAGLVLLGFLAIGLYVHLRYGWGPPTSSR